MQQNPPEPPSRKSIRSRKRAKRNKRAAPKIVPIIIDDVSSVMEYHCGSKVYYCREGTAPDVEDPSQKYPIAVIKLETGAVVFLGASKTPEKLARNRYYAVFKTSDDDPTGVELVRPIVGKLGTALRSLEKGDVSVRQSFAGIFNPRNPFAIEIIERVIALGEHNRRYELKIRARRRVNVGEDVVEDAEEDAGDDAGDTGEDVGDTGEDVGDTGLSINRYLNYVFDYERSAFRCHDGGCSSGDSGGGCSSGDGGNEATADEGDDCDDMAVVDDDGGSAGDGDDGGSAGNGDDGGSAGNGDEDGEVAADEGETATGMAVDNGKGADVIGDDVGDGADGGEVCGGADGGDGSVGGDTDGAGGDTGGAGGAFMHYRVDFSTATEDMREVEIGQFFLSQCYLRHKPNGNGFFGEITPDIVDQPAREWNNRWIEVSGNKVAFKFSYLTAEEHRTIVDIVRGNDKSQY